MNTAVNPYLDFEKPVAQILQRAADYRAAGDEAGARHAEGAGRRLLAETYARLTPWQKTLVARHPQRPHFSDIVKALVEDFTPLAGDRAFGEDEAIIGGLGRLRGQDVPVMVIGHEKGRDTAARVKHNFGMGRPEGYRKAARLVELAGRFNVPVVTLVDSAGAIPALMAKRAARPKPSRAPRPPFWQRQCRSLRPSPVKACRAAPSALRRPIAS